MSFKIRKLVKQLAVTHPFGEHDKSCILLRFAMRATCKEFYFCSYFTDSLLALLKEKLQELFIFTMF